MPVNNDEKKTTTTPVGVDENELVNSPPVNDNDEILQEPEKKTIEKIDDDEVETTVPASSKTTYTPVKGVRLGLDEQMPVGDLTLVDLFLYRNLYASLIVLLSGITFFLMITKFEYSVITFLGRLVLFQVIAFFVYIVGTRFVQKTSGSPDIPLANLTLTEERVRRIVDSIVQGTNTLIRSYVDILLVKDTKRTIQFALIVQFICWLGKHMPGHVLLFVAFIFAFTVPKIYEFKQDEIDKAISIAKRESCKLGQQAWEKVPPNVKEAIHTAKSKIEEFTGPLQHGVSTKKKDD